MDALLTNTLSPWQWAVMGLIPLALIGLYFLKLKRQPLEVPSTHLWHRLIEDQHVNSFWQKLRQNLLLLLQLLVVGLALLALLRPGWQENALMGDRFIFLIDNSASMSATDVTQGRDNSAERDGSSLPAAGSTWSRLDLAKEHVARRIDHMTSDMSAMIITFAEHTQVVQPFTNNRKKLRRALQQIRPSAGRTHLRAALELASGFANPARITSEEDGQEYDVTDQSPVELLILSDGRFNQVDGFSLGNLRPQFLPIGSPEASNLAIVGLSTRPSETHVGQRQVFVQVANFSNQEQRTTIDLNLNGKLVDAAELKIAANGRAGLTFTLGQVAEGILRARLETPPLFIDRLALDNVAYAAMNPIQKGQVLLVTPGNPPLELALATERVSRLAKVDKQLVEFLQRSEYQRLAKSNRYDLMIFDQCVPSQMPSCNTLTIGRIPPLQSWQEKSSDKLSFAPHIVDWQRAHPLLNLIELGNVQIADSHMIHPPLGGKVLVDSTQGPILAIAPRNQFEDVVLGFEIVGHDEKGSRNVNTNWPRRYSFPNFFLNVVQYLASGDIGQDSTVHQPGASIGLPPAMLRSMLNDHSNGDLSWEKNSDLAPTQQKKDFQRKLENLNVILPNATQRTLPPPQYGKYVFHETYELGIYEVRAGKQRLHRFAVNLLDPSESDIRLRVSTDKVAGYPVVHSISIGYVDIAAQVHSVPIRQDLWKGLLLAALVVLMIEWHVYHRRVYV
ncbi:MAG: VWA domain-containing protein [Pirellulales bacterium]